MALDVEKPKTRRAILAAGLGGLGAVAAQALSHPSPADAASNGNVQLGHGTADTDNDSATETRINGTGNGIVALSAYQMTGPGIAVMGRTTTGTALDGESTSGVAVNGMANTTGTGVVGHSLDGPGVNGTSADSTPSTFAGPSNRTGVIGTMGALDFVAQNTDETGVYGYANASSSSTGTVGHSPSGFGVFGVGSVGVAGTGSWGVLGDVETGEIGVYGNTGAHAAPVVAGGVGVLARAESTAQIALQVIGRTVFNRSGRTYVAAGQSNRVITMAGVTTASYVIATLATNRAGVYVQAVVVAAGKFTIYLNKVVPGNTYVAYLVIN